MGVTTLRLEPAQQAGIVLPLVRAAVSSEIARLELALEQAQLRLKPFENRYRVSSDYFVAHMATEDLEEGDDEYVQWAGEYALYVSYHPPGRLGQTDAAPYLVQAQAAGQRGRQTGAEPYLG